MRVIHSDAASIHLASADHTAALEHLDGVPRLSISERVPGEVPAQIWEGTLQAARAIAPQHHHSTLVRSFMGAYVDSGALDDYRAAQGYSGIAAI